MARPVCAWDWAPALCALWRDHLLAQVLIMLIYFMQHRHKGFIPLTTYLRTYKLGDYVDIKVNGAVQKVHSMVFIDCNALHGTGCRPFAACAGTNAASIHHSAQRRGALQL